MMQIDYYFYILRCSDNSLYCGITSEIERRVEEHNGGKKGAKYTRSHRPVELVYCEKYNSKSGALKREYEVKQYSKIQKEELIKSYSKNKI